MKQSKHRLAGWVMAASLGLFAVTAHCGEVVASASSGVFVVDARVVKATTLEGGVIVGGETSLALKCSSSAWGVVSDGNGVSITYRNDTTGESGTIATKTTAESVEWTPPAEKGTYELKHQVVDSSGMAVGTALTAMFEVEVYAVSILAQPTLIDHATAAVYTNGVLSTETSSGSGLWNAWSNETAEVVYTAANGYVFAGGETVVTNALDTTKNPATADAPATPTKLAVKYVAPVYVDGVASNGIAYWTTNEVSTYTVVTNSASTQTWGEAGKTNWYVATEANVGISNGIVCKGFVNLILCKGAKLTVEGAKYCAGIQTDDNGTFVIYGTPQGEGELSATGGYNGAGIGGSADYDNGFGSHITINGGKVTAQSTGLSAAGIGSAIQSHAGYDITINGGTVIAKAAQYGLGAGIGGSVQSEGHDITINGGRVLACGSNGVAIGGGCAAASPYDYSDENTYGYNITINGGSVCVSGQGDIIGSRTLSHPAYNNRIAAGANVLFCLDAGLEEPLELTGSMVLVGSAESLADLSYKLAGGLVGFGIETLTMTNATTHETQTVAVGDEALVPFSGKKAAVRVSDGFAKLFVGQPIEATPTAVPHAKITGVYTNGVLSSESSPWTVWTYEPAFAVYEAESGYVFQDGSTVMTNYLDTTVSPATSTRPLPSALQGPPVAELRDAEGVWQGVYDSLGTAIAAAQEGETVTLLTNLQESVTFNNACAVTLDLAGWTLTSSGSAPIIKVAAEDAALTIRDTSAAKTGSITTGGKTYSGDGAGIYVVKKASLSMRGVVITNCVASGSGGAIYVEKNARILLKDCTLRNNRAGVNGGAICVMGGLMTEQKVDPTDKCLLIRTVITDNQATASGGGVYYESTHYNGCLAAGTQVQMADGSAKAIEEVVEGDVVRTFDHKGGTNSTARVYYAFKGAGKATPFTLEFEGEGGAAGVRALPIVGCHDLLEQGSLKYVTITSANVGQYIGAKFYGADGAWHTLTNVTMGTEAVDYYSIYSAQHQNVYANGMLTVADDVDYLLNIYELDENLTADADRLAADLAQYGEMSYEEAETYGVSREWYEDGGMKYLNVAIGKQLVSKAYAEQLFASTGRAQNATPLMAAAPKMMTSAPMMATTSNVADPTFDDVDVSRLTIGEGVIVTNNIGGTKPSNIYLRMDASNSRYSYISLKVAHSGVCAGVTLETGSGKFTDESASSGDVAYFWDDAGTYAVWHHSNNYLYLYDGSQIVPPAVAHTSCEVFVGGVSKGSATSVAKNTSATVVYTVDPGYEFASGATTKEVAVDTSKTVATMTPPDAPILLVKYVVPVYNGTDGNPTNGIAYWETNTCANYSLVTSVVAPAGHKWGEDGKTTWLVVADPGVVITGSPKCFGHVNLILCDGASLRVTDGIRTDSNALTIYAGCEGTGELLAEGPFNGAGIGCGYTGSGNNITINGGRITATGGRDGAAGIGGGCDGSASNIVINAGVITAIGGGNETSGGAGIGGGQSGTASHIVINGGTVVATGAVYAAGIGGGNSRPGMSIVINDGAVQAVGGHSGAGIGGGSGGAGTNLVIRGGKVIATGGDFGAGIGGGQSGAGSQIAISGGDVRATGGVSAAAIGGGSYAAGADVTIAGGEVTAIGGGYAAGIGGGSGGKGSGVRIAITSGTVTAIAGYNGAGIGGGRYGGASQIAIGGEAKVFVGSPCALSDGEVQRGDLIGCGYDCEEAAEDVTVAATAQVFFNLTGCYDKSGDEWIEEVAPMPADFGGFVLMTPERQTVNRVLVGGYAVGGGTPTLPAFALTNAVTGATDEIAVDGEETTFAGTYCALTNVNGNLTFAIRPPVLTVTQQPNIANDYSIVATTDGNDDITNYAWCVQTETTTGFVVLTNAFEAASEIGYTVHGEIEGTAIRSFKDDDENDPVIWLLWLPEDNAFGITGIPKGGKLHFSCASDISADNEELLGSIHRIGETDEWVWDAKLYDVSEGEGVFSYLLQLSASGPFTIDNLRWVASSYEPVAQGATMTALPADKGVVGKKYICRMDYGHEGVFYTGASDVFTYLVPIQVGDDAWAAIDAGACLVFGTGDMWSYETAGASPLWDCRASITNLVFEDGVTSVGARFFENMWYLKDVSLGAGVTNVGARAFKKCYGLTNVTAAATGALAVGNWAFAGSHSLQALAFAGTPTFGTECYTMQTAIYMRDGIPEVYPIPQITVAGLTEHILATNDLTLPDSEWTDVTDLSGEERRAYHFFKIVLK